MMADLIAAGLQEGFSDLRRAAIPETWGHDIEVPDSMLTSGGGLPCGAAFKSPISHDATMLTPGAAISGCNRVSLLELIRQK